MEKLCVFYLMWDMYLDWRGIFFSELVQWSMDWCEFHMDLRLCPVDSKHVEFGRIALPKLQFFLPVSDSDASLGQIVVWGSTWTVPFPVVLWLSESLLVPSIHPILLWEGKLLFWLHAMNCPFCTFSIASHVVSGGSSRRPLPEAPNSWV